MGKKREVNSGLLDLPLRAPLAAAAEELVRSKAPRRCVVTVSWTEIEPEAGHYSAAAFCNVRNRLLDVIALDCDPIICLFRGSEPAWFSERGGWDREDNIVSYLRFAGRLVRETAHLAAGYMTFYAPNEYAWDKGHNPIRFYRRLSHMACAHIRAYRLVRDLCDSRGFRDRPIGVGMRLFPLRGVLPEKDAEFPPLAPAVFQSIPLRAFDEGKFSPPMVNTLRAQSGTWCDYIAVRPVADREGAVAAAKAVSETPLWLMETTEDEECGNV